MEQYEALLAMLLWDRKRFGSPAVITAAVAKVSRSVSTQAVDSQATIRVRHPRLILVVWHGAVLERQVLMLSNVKLTPLPCSPLPTYQNFCWLPGSDPNRIGCGLLRTWPWIMEAAQAMDLSLVS